MSKLDEDDALESFKSTFSSFDLTPYIKLYSNEMDSYIQENYINKLMNTVSYLMKEDLADMAESLVRMTCLKRHFTTDEETVGGPVDVAIITKGDGFIWIKRKHSYPADDNHYYLDQ